MLTLAQEDALVEAYRINHNGVGIDSLGGTIELRHITSTFNVWTRGTLDESAVLSLLITLRKRGVLLGTPRKPREPGPPTWDRRFYTAGTNRAGRPVRYYEVPIAVHVDLATVIHAITLMPVLPVLRAEVIDYFSKNIHTILGTSRNDDRDDDDTEPYDAVHRLAVQLFPELVV